MAIWFQIFMILGLLLGNVFSTIAPYLRKLYEGKITKFDPQYLIHSVIAAVWQFIISLPLWFAWESPSGFAAFWAFLLAIAFGYGGRDAQIELTKIINFLQARNN